MADCEVESSSSISQIALNYLRIKNRNFSENSFVDIIDDYVPIEVESTPCDYLDDGNQIINENSCEEKIDEPYLRQLKNASLYIGKNKSVVELGKFGWKLYDYIEQALGLKEEGTYEPQFEENSSRHCVECAWNSSAGGLLKGLDNILRGFRACGLCSQTYCYNHCAYKRKLQSTSEKEHQKVDSIDADDGKSWILVCKKCFEKGETQELGQTKDHTSAFVKLRAKKNNVVEQRQDKILRNLENLSKKLPQQADSFSIWNLSNALPSAVELFQPSDPSRKNCAICEVQFSFWVKHQTCRLCSSLCCTSCCNFSVPLAKSTINPNGPTDKAGEVLACKHCYHLVNLKKKRIRFSQQCISEESKLMMKQYEYIVALKKEIDKNLSDYLEKTEILDSSILDHFQMVPKTKKDEPMLVSFSDPIRTGSQKQLEKMKPLFLEYQQSVTKLLEIPAPTKREKQVLTNIKTAFQHQEGYVLLSEKISNDSKKE